MTNLNPINERNIERLIDEALAQRDGLLAKLRTATNLDMRRTLAAELTIAGELSQFPAVRRGHQNRTRFRCAAKPGDAQGTGTGG